jgi:hypothetical protein
MGPIGSSVFPRCPIPTARHKLGEMSVPSQRENLGILNLVPLCPRKTKHTDRPTQKVSRGLCEYPLKKVSGTLAFFFFFPVLELELRAFTLSHSTSPIFVKSFFEIGSRELFAWPGFELLSSRFLPPE